MCIIIKEIGYWINNISDNFFNKKILLVIKNNSNYEDLLNFIPHNNQQINLTNGDKIIIQPILDFPKILVNLF